MKSEKAFRNAPDDFSQKIQEILGEIRRLRFEDRDQVMKLCHMLLSMDEAKQEPYLQAEANFGLADAYYAMYDRARAMNALNLAMQQYHEAEEWVRLGECYNLMGLLFHSQCDYLAALESFSDAIELAEEKHLSHVGLLANLNDAVLCFSVGADQEALKHALAALTCVMEEKDTEQFPSYYLAVLYDLIEIYMRLGMMDEAGRQMRELDLMQEKYPERIAIFPYQVLHILWAQIKHAHDEEAEYLTKALESFEKTESHLMCFGECELFMNYLLEQERFTELLWVTDVLQKELGQDTQMISQAVKVAKKRIACFQHSADLPRLLEAFEHYRELTEVQDSQTADAVRTMVELRNSLTASRRTNLLLQERVRTDAMTGIGNRGAMDEDANRILENCKAAHRMMGVAMLDIDKFKQVNDTHDHQTGDNCILCVGAVLKSVETDRIRCYRYGGDEFMIYFDGVDETGIRDLLETVSRRVAQTIAQDHLPSFTLSQGAVCGVPGEKTRMWDFTSMADHSMYEVKNAGGDRILIRALDVTMF